MPTPTGSKISDSWNQGSPYERFMGRWSRKAAPLFLEWLAMPPGLRWLDVGCGTGALSAAIAERFAPASLAGVEPSEGFLAAARENLGDRANVMQGSATAIPLPNASVDVVVSGLVLNFVPEKEAALAEMRRVAVPGGTLGAYIWDYGGRMQLLRYFWDAVVELDPSSSSLDEGARFPVCRPEALDALLRHAGLVDVMVRPIELATTFASFDDYWQPYLGGQGPAPAYAMSLDEAARARLRDNIRARLPVNRDGSIDLVARAWAARGLTPG